MSLYFVRLSPQFERQCYAMTSVPGEISEKLLIFSFVKLFFLCVIDSNDFQTPHVLDKKPEVSTYIFKSLNFNDEFSPNTCRNKYDNTNLSAGLKKVDNRE